MKFIKILGLIILIISTNSYSIAQDFEGIITYKSTEKLHDKSSDSITRIHYYVRQDKIATLSQSNFGDQRYIIDLSKETGTLLLSMNGEHYALTQNLKDDTTKQVFNIKKQRGKLTIAGVKSKKYSISGGYLDTTLVIYISKAYPANIVKSYPNLPGLPTKYTLIVQGEPINYELVSIERQPITNDFFAISQEYKQMTMQEFLDELGGK